MKKHPQDENYPLRVRAETLRYLSRTELAVVDGGVIQSGGHATNVAVAGEPTGTSTNTRIA